MGWRWNFDVRGTYIIVIIIYSTICRGTTQRTRPQQRLGNLRLLSLSWLCLCPYVCNFATKKTSAHKCWRHGFGGTPSYLGQKFLDAIDDSKRRWRHLALLGSNNNNNVNSSDVELILDWQLWDVYNTFVKSFRQWSPSHWKSEQMLTYKELMVGFRGHSNYQIGQNRTISVKIGPNRRYVLSKSGPFYNVRVSER